MSLIPITAKAEFHVTYRCNLKCKACTRATWLREPHTADMTLDDVRKFFAQADEIGWKGFQPEKEKARIILIGGEPTLHPDYLEIVRMIHEWSGTYSQTYSNGSTPNIRMLLDLATMRYSASVCNEGFKTVASTGRQDWNPYTFVSPWDCFGRDFGVCYCHPSQICGFCVDHDGYAMCPVGASMSKLTVPMGSRTRCLKDLFLPDFAEAMTRFECRHCGFEFHKRVGVSQAERDQYAKYAKECEVVGGMPMSPTWITALKDRINR